MREIATASTPYICHFNLETAALLLLRVDGRVVCLPMHFFAARVFVRRLWLTAASAALNSHKPFQLTHWLGISSRHGVWTKSFKATCFQLNVFFSSLSQTVAQFLHF